MLSYIRPFSHYKFDHGDHEPIVDTVLILEWGRWAGPFKVFTVVSCSHFPASQPSAHLSFRISHTALEGVVTCLFPWRLSFPPCVIGVPPDCALPMLRYAVMAPIFAKRNKSPPLAHSPLWFYHFLLPDLNRVACISYFSLSLLPGIQSLRLSSRI